MPEGVKAVYAQREIELASTLTQSAAIIIWRPQERARMAAQARGN
jgi:hypothetical protein